MLSAPEGMSFTDGLIEWVPSNAQVETAYTDIELSDGLNTVIQSCTISVANVNDLPIITSTPPSAAVIGLDYEYNVIASDPDGDNLLYALDIAPPGMTVSSEGVVLWSKTEVRTDGELVRLKVSDNAGGEVFQEWTISVQQDQEPPAVSIHFSMNPVLPMSSVQVTVEAFDNVGIREIGLSVDGEEIVLDENNSFSYQTGQVDTALFEAWAIDSNGNQAASTGTLVVSSEADTTAPVVTVSFSPAVPAIGDIVSYQFSVDDPLQVDAERVWLKVDGVYIPLINGQGQAKVLRLGVHNVIATAYDLSGNYGEATTSFNVSVSGSDATLPTAVITSPATDSTFSGDIEIIGTAADTNFAFYKLSYRSKDKASYIEFARSEIAVANGLVGSFNGSMLENDDYELRLDVFDKYGNIASAVRTVRVTDQLKNGIFTLSFEDLQIPLPGMNLDILRTYDSRDKYQGDFGVAWKLGIRTLSLSENCITGEGWQVQKDLFDSSYYLKVEQLPVETPEETMWLLNFTGCYNAFKKDEAEFETDPQTGDIIKINKYAFIPRRLSASTVFKIPEMNSIETYCYEGLYDPEEEFWYNVTDNKLSGLVFEKIWKFPILSVT